VARGTQHRKRRPPQNARLAPAPAGPKRPKRPAYEEQLFFGRLRVHAKWLFVFLALVFSLGFIFLGIGSGSTGISQIVQNFFSGSSAGGTSLSSLQKKTQEHPKDAAAWLAYANKLQQKNKPDDAATALTTYTQLRPKDTGALLQLAGIYLQRAYDWQTLLNASNARTTALSPAYVLAPPSSSKLAQGLQTVATPLTQAVTAETASVTQDEQTKVTGYLTQRVDVYRKLATINPKDATTQLSLATAATDANDATTAIGAYKAFLKLAPNDSQAPTARKALKQLESQQSATIGGGGVHKITVP
jgi:cytochrome c-type biogenesis protein CcmH/NrfG